VILILKRSAFSVAICNAYSLAISFCNHFKDSTSPFIAFLTFSKLSSVSRNWALTFTPKASSKPAPTSAKAS
jgi:hypothetical protein